MKEDKTNTDITMLGIFERIQEVEDTMKEMKKIEEEKWDTDDLAEIEKSRKNLQQIREDTDMVRDQIKGVGKIEGIEEDIKKAKKEANNLKELVGKDRLKEIDY